MSMSPPPPYPAGPPDPYRHDPYSGFQNQAGRHAAASVWVSAGLFLLLSTCCTAGIGVMGVVPLDQIDPAGQLPPENRQQIAQAQPYLPYAAVVLALLTVVPAVVLLVLGFSVSRGGRGATLAALVLAGAGLALVGLGLLVSILTNVTSGQIDLCSPAVFLIMAGCLVWCVLSLKRALVAVRHPTGAAQHPAPAYHSVPPPHQPYPDDDPWEHAL